MIKDSCVILNQAFTDVEYIEMKEKMKTFQKEQEKDDRLLNEGIKKPFENRHYDERNREGEREKDLWTDTMQGNRIQKSRHDNL